MQPLQILIHINDVPKVLEWGSVYCGM